MPKNSGEYADIINSELENAGPVDRFFSSSQMDINTPEALTSEIAKTVHDVSINGSSPLQGNSLEESIKHYFPPNILLGAAGISADQFIERWNLGNEKVKSQLIKDNFRRAVIDTVKSAYNDPSEPTLAKPKLRFSDVKAASDGLFDDWKNKEVRSVANNIWTNLVGEFAEREDGEAEERFIERIRKRTASYYERMHEIAATFSSNEGIRKTDDMLVVELALRLANLTWFCCPIAQTRLQKESSSEKAQQVLPIEKVNFTDFNGMVKAKMFTGIEGEDNINIGAKELKKDLWGLLQKWNMIRTRRSPWPEPGRVSKLVQSSVIDFT